MSSRRKPPRIKIIVDTNIVFSGILNSSGKIGKILISSNRYFQLYTCNFLKDEILKHQNKIHKLTHLSLKEIEELELLVTKNITFINEALIPEAVIKSTKKLLANIDINDTPFVALARHIGAKLWTGDKHLMDGLKKKKFKNVISTSELADLLYKFESNK